jgi:hypothetical protein
MRKLITGAAALAAVALSVAGTTAASASVRPNATPACSSNCFDLSSLLLGRGTLQNAYVPGDTGVGAKIGQKVNMHVASNSQINEDFTGAQVGTLGDFCSTALKPGNLLAQDAYVCVNYPFWYPVFESDVSPFGNETGLCAGATLPETTGENVTLQTCGISGSTLWVGDLKNETTSHGHVYFPWVSGGSTSFSHPLTLQVDPGTKSPGNQLKLAPLNTLTGSVSPDAQEFTFTSGPAS